MQLSSLIAQLSDSKVISYKEASVKGIACDSRKVKSGYIFVAIQGVNQDGNKFIKQAIKRGAIAIISQVTPKTLPGGITWISCKDSRASLAQLAARFFGQPSKNMKVIGITGTNGKTTVSYLVEYLLKAKKRDIGVIGTINYRFKNQKIPAQNTTPGPIEIQSLLARFCKIGIDYAVIEVSSHALDQQRVRHIKFSHAVFTNLSQDHLDYHHKMENYFLAKSKLFKGLKPQAVSIINIDDKFSKKLIKLTKSKILTYGFDPHADIRASGVKTDIQGTKFTLWFKKRKIKMKTKLIGLHNVYNVLAGISVAIAEKVSLNQIKERIGRCNPPPGRLENIAHPCGFRIYVDYAHTPAALKNALLTLKKLSCNELIVVFGCGGERDKKKRGLMGKIASQIADYVIITSDNPRHENPLAIIREIRRGIKKNNYCTIPRRDKAILAALKRASEGDIVLIAGKGHENYQILKDKIIPFDDRKMVRRFLT